MHAHLRSTFYVRKKRIKTRVMALNEQHVLIVILNMAIPPFPPSMVEEAPPSAQPFLSPFILTPGGAACIEPGACDLKAFCRSGSLPLYAARSVPIFTKNKIDCDFRVLEWCLQMGT